MEYLRVFETRESHSNAKDLPTPCVSYVKEFRGIIFSTSGGTVNDPMDKPIEPPIITPTSNYIVATYNVRANESNQILGISDILLNLFDKMIINGIEMSPSLTHTFSQSGIVEIQWVLKDEYTSFSQLFEECYTLVELDFSNCDMTNVSSMVSMLQGCDGVSRMVFDGDINPNIDCLDMFGNSYNGDLYYDQTYASNYANVLEWAETNMWELHSI